MQFIYSVMRFEKTYILNCKERAKRLDVYEQNFAAGSYATLVHYNFDCASLSRVKMQGWRKALALQS